MTVKIKPTGFNVELLVTIPKGFKIIKKGKCKRSDLIFSTTRIQDGKDCWLNASEGMDAENRYLVIRKSK